MTQIQIDWSRAQETKRHNVATEIQAVNELNETVRHNVVYEKETHRHNKVTESETKRHNVKTEGLTGKQLKEQHRHNVKTEKLTDKDIKEKKRHNIKTEKISSKDVQERKRHNIETERQQAQRIEAEINKVNAEIANLNARTIAQQFANEVDMSNPAMFTANRYAKVFDKRNAPAMVYAGVKATDSVFRDAITGSVDADTAVKHIDSKYYNKHKRHMSAAEKQNWKHAIVEAANAWTDILVGGKSTAEHPKPVRN